MDLVPRPAAPASPETATPAGERRLPSLRPFTCESTLSEGWLGSPRLWTDEFVRVSPSPNRQEEGLGGRMCLEWGGRVRSWWETWKTFLETWTQSLACALVAQ